MARTTQDHSFTSWIGCLLALLLAACGGGGGEAALTSEAPESAAPAATPAPAPAPAPTTTAAPATVTPVPDSASTSAATTPSPRSGVSRLIVAGDSLADVGTYGIKFTVQNSANPAGFSIYPEWIAAAYGLPGGCSHFMDNGAGGVVARGDPGCTNFAVGAARILRGEGPQNIPFQLQEAAAALGGRFDAGDLVLIDGGANDASELAAAYLVGTTGRTGMLAFLAFLAREVAVDDLLATAPGDASLARSANLYLEKAADKLADAVADALQRGAMRVAVLNMPDVTRTPRFSAAFARLVPQLGVDEATAVQSAVRQTVGAFNARLQSRLGSDARVVLVDVRAAVDDQITHASAWGLTDATHAACPITGLNSAGLPEWSLETCSSAGLDATPGTTPGWWTTWAFADGFHPTPMGHRLLADTIARALTAASWP